MGVRLTVTMRSASGTDQSKTVVLDDEVITFGRDAACEVVLAQHAVSRNHARITQDGSLFFLEDLNSSFGTLINGQKLPKNEKRLLNNGDLIAIAQFDIVFDRVADSSPTEGDVNTSFLSRKVVKDVMRGLAGAGEVAYFRVMNGPKEGERLEIADAQEYILGRDAADVDFVLDDDLVSRKHVKVRRDWSGTHVEDLGSRNGIKLNKERTRKATIKDRDELEIGGVRLLFVDPNEVREAAVVMAASESLDEPDDEGTLSVQAEEAPVAEEPAAEAEAPLEEAPPAEEAENQPAESEMVPPVGDEADEDEASQKMGIDFGNRQHLFALGLGGVMVVVGLVLLIMLFVGA